MFRGATVIAIVALQESYCSKSKKKNGDGEAVGRSFWGEQWLFSPKNRFSQPTGDALRFELLLTNFIEFNKNTRLLSSNIYIFYI